VQQPGSTVNTTSHFVSESGVTGFSPWTIANSSPTAAAGTIMGRILDGNGSPVSGAVINLSGSQSRKTIADANGGYSFENVDTAGFYTVTPSRANYMFSPINRSFSQLGASTDAAFAGSSIGDVSNPLDTAEYFVRQQYVDILGREPDESGFNYWSDQINGCGADGGCVQSRRTAVAAAFFIEPEGQETGSFIYELYKDGLGRAPVYSEYSSDHRQVLGGPNLEAEKSAFASSFVSRPEFQTKYQSNTTAEGFVDAIVQNVMQVSGVDLRGERASLIATYNTSTDQTTSRSLVIRLVADDAGFKQSQYDPAFVLTEYFAYLERDPDQGGYDFWLGVLDNREPGNYLGMVCAFTTSTEYQRRFSSIVSHSNGECH
jgi:hypothetical protein